MRVSEIVIGAVAFASSVAAAPGNYGHSKPQKNSYPAGNGHPKGYSNKGWGYHHEPDVKTVCYTQKVDKPGRHHTRYETVYKTDYKKADYTKTVKGGPVYKTKTVPHVAYTSVADKKVYDSTSVVYKTQNKNAYSTYVSSVYTSVTTDYYSNIPAPTGMIYVQDSLPEPRRKMAIRGSNSYGGHTSAQPQSKNKSYYALKHTKKIYNGPVLCTVTKHIKAKDIHYTKTYTHTQPCDTYTKTWYHTSTSTKCNAQQTNTKYSTSTIYATSTPVTTVTSTYTSYAYTNTKTAYDACATSNMKSTYKNAPVLAGYFAEDQTFYLSSDPTTAYDCCVAALNYQRSAGYLYSEDLAEMGGRCMIIYDDSETCNAPKNYNSMSVTDSTADGIGGTIGNMGCGQFYDPVYKTGYAAIPSE